MGERIEIRSKAENIVPLDILHSQFEAESIQICKHFMYCMVEWVVGYVLLFSA